MTLRGFATLTLWADDVQAATDWYAGFLGLDAYFTRSAPDGTPAYAEFRVGDHADELGIIDRRYHPTGGDAGPGGVIIHWHVDDVRATHERLLALGATEYQPLTERGSGFVTASVVDPFGNVLGIMQNPHYVEVVDALGRP